jgi:hydrogenase 3 maturation protease
VNDTLNDLLSHRDLTILFVGIGNPLRKDDGIGVYISTHIRETEVIKAITVEVSIENYIGKINSVRHDILVMIDCADIGRPPGSYHLLPVSDTTDLTFNTHNISLRRVSEFFKGNVLLLAIQPENIDFGEDLSYLVKEAGNTIIELINKKEV